ncbi:S41 family peptidase [Candidatus Nomurabacteria bacterium]|nr:S41 family peptidase [Candidatus Nomurabacteria bacterium]
MEETPTHIKKGFRTVLSVLFGAALFLAGVYVGYENRPAMAKVVGIVSKEPPESVVEKTDFNLFWKAWETVQDKLPDADKTDSSERLYGAIQGLLGSFGDPYTTFFPPKENEEFATQISGEFSGVGIGVDEKNDLLTVIAPLKGTPAEKAGIKPGDSIIKIDDILTTALTIDEAIDHIRGKEGTNVVLTIGREGEKVPLVFTLVRTKIVIPTVETNQQGDVFIISLYNFSAHAVSEFQGAFRQYRASGSHKLIVDLRGNPGGYLDAAVDIASIFLPEGKVVVKEIGKTPQDVTSHTSHGTPLFGAEDKLIILVDKGSASASEILAGALSEYKVGTLVGTQTFGKGSVQELIPLDTQTSIKVTVAKWYTPQGVSISDNGLTPQVEILQNPDKEGDEQLEKAIELLNK